MKINNGKSVSIAYTMSFENDGVVETSEGSEPLDFIQGQHEILRGVERALEGLEAGAETSVSLAPDQAFGAVEPDAIVVVEKSRIPEDARQQGAVVETEDDEGNTMTGEVTSLSEEMVTLDFNHPLAGKTIQFDIKVLSVTEGGQGENIIELEPRRN